MTLFTELQLRPEIMRALDQCSFTEATPIQAATIPLALAGRDILGTAQTGTGKTAAFGIPLITRLLDNPQEAALVLTPTRELATQVLTTLRNLIDRETRMRVALLIGGDSMTKQLAQLHAKPRLIVATPGRLNDHLRRQSVSLRNVRFLVLDETDRMLDMGFGIQIDDILHHMPQSRQTLLFSATLPGNIMQLAGRYMNNPERIAVGSVNTPAADIEQETLHMPQSEKYRRLVEQLDQREGSVIVFVRTKNDADHLSAKLQELNYSADALHGDLRQRQRDRAIKAFRAQQTRIMVATDIAARGLDIPHIEHVINYDMPQCPEDYVHRIGRTARAGAHGSALNFVSPHDSKKWHAICRMLQPKDGSGSSYGGSHGGSSRAPGRSGEYSSRPKRQGDARTPYANKNAERTSSSPYAPKKDFGRPERANRDGFDSRKPREDRPRDGYNAPSANGYQGKDRPHREGQAERTPFRKPREDGFESRKPREDRPRDGYNAPSANGYKGRDRSDSQASGSSADRSYGGERPRSNTNDTAAVTPFKKPRTDRNRSDAPSRDGVRFEKKAGASPRRDGHSTDARRTQAGAPSRRPQGGQGGKRPSRRPAA